MHGYTVFDNNAYKRVSRERLERIMTAEQELGILPQANVAVLQELFARVQDDDDEQRARNRAAVRKLGEHCHIKRDGMALINFVSHTDGQVYRLIAGETHPDDCEALDRLADMVRVVAQAGNDDPLREIELRLDEIRRTVATVEKAYVARLESAIKQDVESNKMKRNLNYAWMIVARAQQLYGHEFRSEAVVLRIIEIAKHTSIGFELNDAVLHEVRRKGGGHGQHANTIWDEEVVSSTSMYTMVGGKSIVLVTEEDRLLAAAQTAGAADRVVNLAAYEALLGLSRWRVRAGR